MHDLLSNPEKYEDGVAELVQELHSGAKSLDQLSEPEKDLLDRATIDFNSPNRRPEPLLPKSPPPAPPKAAKKKVKYTPGTDVNDLEPYWWLK
jgi:hypothetical protein